MLRNNIEVDVKVKCIEAGSTQAELAIRKKDTIVNKTFLAMMEALGYDVELKYVKREDV